MKNIQDLRFGECMKCGGNFVCCGCRDKYLDGIMTAKQYDELSKIADQVFKKL